MDAKQHELIGVELSDTAETLPSPVLVAKIAKLILASTLLAAVVFPFVVPVDQVLIYIMGPLLFALVYVLVLYLAQNGRPVAGAWVFIASTWIGQMGVIIAAGGLTAQALVSCVNLILSTGFMLGKRVVFAVSTVCVSSMFAFVWVHDSGVLVPPVIEVGAEPGFVALVCVLFATAGLTYIGVDNFTAALNAADVNARKTAAALVELEKARQADSIRANRAERLGIMARNVVGLVDAAKLTQDVAIGLKDVLDAAFVIVVDKAGLPMASAGLAEKELPSDWFVEDHERWIPQGGFTILDDAIRDQLLKQLEITQQGRVFAARGTQTSVTLLAFGQEPWIPTDELEWSIQVATNLLDSAMVRFESERRMGQAQKMEALHRLSAGIAHDFNNLLTTILGGAELVEYKTSTDNPIQKYLRRIRDAGERAASLTTKLMTFTRGGPKSRELVEISTLVRDLMPMIRRTVEESIQIEIATSDQPLWVDADPIEVERIVLNLVANARDAIGRSGRIDIGIKTVESRTQRAGNQNVVLWVRDDGEGMDLDTRTRVFEPFFTTRKGKGATGLGLSIVYGLVQALDGDVFLDSQKGIGTRVEVHLPTIVAPQTQSPAERPLKRSAAGARVLVVEDDPDVRETVCEMLELGGFNTASVGSGEEALTALKSSQAFNLVISDVIMPSMSGFDLAEAMQTNGHQTPLVLISGYARRNHDAESGGPDIPRITKPFSMSELLTFVQTHMA